jgi:hypothetical protein
MSAFSAIPDLVRARALLPPGAAGVDAFFNIFEIREERARCVAPAPLAAKYGALRSRCEQRAGDRRSAAPPLRRLRCPRRRGGGQRAVGGGCAQPVQPDADVLEPGAHRQAAGARARTADL